MFKKDTRRGLALGAAFALVSSLFVAAPAAQADEASTVVTPMVGTSSTMLITEPFVVKTRLGINVDASKISNLKYLIEKPAGYLVTVSNTVSSDIDASVFTGATTGTQSAIAGTATHSYVTPLAASTTGVNQLRLQVFTTSGVTSLSAKVTIKVTAFLDVDPDGKFTSNEPNSVYEVTFVPWADLGATVTLATPVRGAPTVSAEATVTGVNFEQLEGTFKINLKSTYDNANTSSAALTPTALMTYSVPVSASAPLNASYSATVFYDFADNGIADGEVLKVSKLGVVEATITGVTASVVAGNNVLVTGAGSADSRLNSEFALKVWAHTGSTVVAAKVPTVTVTTSTVVLSATKYVVVNGVTYTQSSVLKDKAITLTAGTDGKGNLVISTVGFATGETLTIGIASENQTGTYAVTPRVVTWSVSRTAGDYVVALAGESVTAEFAVADQFGVASPLADQRVEFSIAGGAISTSTQSIAVVGGKATVTVAAKSATATGSYTITPNLQYVDRNGTVTNESNANETAVTVYVLTAISNKFNTKPVASLSASISYGVAMSWSAAITANLDVTGSSVVASAPGVIFQYDSKTYSDSVTMTAGSAGAVSFKATSRLAGKYTISFVAGTATASTLLVVDAAAHDAATALSFDKTSIVAGATSTITGKLVDANGNPVATGGTASLTVKWTGKGLPFNLGATTQTDEDGEFSFQVLVLGTELGEAAISATYMPTGSSTSTKNLTFVQKIDVVAEAAVAPSDKKLTVGTFNGYIAIYAKGYEGSKLSAKVAGKWLTVAELSNFQRVVRKTGAGYSIKVDLYIDGVFAQSSTTVTK